jgi:outer membrane protein assembly factor BamB
LSNIRHALPKTTSLGSALLRIRLRTARKRNAVGEKTTPRADPSERKRTMRSFEIFVAPDPRAASSYGALPLPPEGTFGNPRLEETPSSNARRLERPAREVLDVFIGGANVSALVGAGESLHGGPPAFRTTAGIAGVLRDLGAAALALSKRARGKTMVRLYDEPWELCVERLGSTASLSVYRGGTEPQVAVYDRIVPFADVLASLREAVADVVARGDAPAPLLVELTAIEQELATTPPPPSGESVSLPPPSPVVVDHDPTDVVSLATEFAMREGHDEAEGGRVERTDVHALLFRGRIRASIRGRAVDLGDGHPFLLAERLMGMVRQMLDAWERGAAHHARAEAGAVLLGIRLDADGSVALTLGSARRDADRAIYTFPALSVPDLVDGAIAFGRALARAMLRRDRSQAQNLRLTAFRRQLRETSDLLREASKDDALVNPSPESYRAFLAPLRDGSLEANRGTSEPKHDRGQTRSPARLRYTQRWRALVPGIDLRATFLCGDRLVVGGAAETFCLDRATGEVLWRAPTERATSVVTPGGIARLSPEGELSIHDFGTGEVTLRSWLAPRTGGPPAGAVVNMPGLPRLLILTEGERHLVAIDLASGEPRWRFAWGRKGTLRLKRAGRLLYFTCGDSALTALDVLTGEVVWRARDRLRFRGPPVLDHDMVLAVAGGVHSRAHLVAVDAFSGRPRWMSPIAPEAAVLTVEGAPLSAGGAILCAIRDRQGVKLAAWDRETGEPIWTTSSYVATSGTSWLGVDDLLIGNTPTGELVAIEAQSGALRYRHRLGPILETDVPRRLEPVLRSGALFIPHAEIPIVRPRDGVAIGTVGSCDAIPDLLRVDERCDVYVAEESGHLASFAAGPRLSLVK